MQTQDEPLALLSEKDIRSALDPIMQAIDSLHDGIIIRQGSQFHSIQIVIDTSTIEQLVRDAAQKLLTQITAHYQAQRHG